MSAPSIQGASGSEGEALTYASINENNKDIFTFTANESVSWSISGGEQNLFIIDKDTGKLSFKNNPDYESSFKVNGTILKFDTNFSTDTVSDKFFIEIYDRESDNYNYTPITASNFFQYVNDNSYQNSLIHRLVPGLIIQSGGYTRPVNSSNEVNGSPIQIQSKGAIINEAFNSNLMGTVAMAKVSNQPNSATSEWFFNLSDNLNLDTQNEGFTVFGHVLGDGIKNPLLLNSQKTYTIKYNETGLNLEEFPLINLQNNTIQRENYFVIQDISNVDKRPSDISNKYNVIVTASDLEGNKSNQYVIIEVNDIQGEVIDGDNEINTISGGIGNDVFTGNSGNDLIDGGSDYDTAKYSGNFSDYSFTISNKQVTVKDNRSSINDGTDTLSNIERLIFADKNALVTSKEIKMINSLGFKSEKVYTGKSDTYKFYDLGSDKYGVGTESGIDELTGASLLKFEDKSLNLSNDIKATFDQVTALNDATGQMFRLYNAAFARFPDADGLKYWIGNFSSGKDDSRAVSSSFLASAEFKQRYGEDISHETYVKNLYQNVLDRDLDQSGYDYWVGNLNNGIEQRHEVLLGFSESAENKGLFSEMTGLF